MTTRSTLSPLRIVGGGLAGLSLGLALRRQEVPVTIIEAGFYPRHRVCGEFMCGLPHDVRNILGLENELGKALHHRSVAWYRKGRRIALYDLPETAYGLSRHAMDDGMARRFVAMGGSLQTRQRVPCDEDQPGWVRATGRIPSSGRWIGLKMHATGLTTRADLEVHLGQSCYAGVSAVEDGRVNVCGLFFRPEGLDARDKRGYFLRVLEYGGMSDLAQRLAGGYLEEESFCAVSALHYRWPRAASHGFSIGDSYSLIPPFTGDGMSMALTSGVLAASPLLDWSRGRISWAEACRRYHFSARRTFSRRLFWANKMHSFLLGNCGQSLLAFAARSKLLPFKQLYHKLH